MRLLFLSAAMIALVAAGAGCGPLPPPATPADAKALHEQMRKLNEEVIRQEGRDAKRAKKR
jgi:hypothetical protein